MADPARDQLRAPQIFFVGSESAPIRGQCEGGGRADSLERAQWAHFDHISSTATMVVTAAVSARMCMIMTESPARARRRPEAARSYVHPILHLGGLRFRTKHGADQLRPRS